MIDLIDFIIGLDLDGVCYHYDRTARYMLRRRIEDRGELVPAVLFEPSATWDAVENAVSAEDFRWLYDEGVYNGLFRYGHVVGGAIEGIQALNELGDVVAITARPKQAVHDTIVWLATMFDKAPLAGLNIQSHGQRKSQVSPTPDIYIDDAIHNVEDILANTDSKVVLFSQPWNEAADIDGVRARRAVGWRETVDLVRDAKAGVWA